MSFPFPRTLSITDSRNSAPVISKVAEMRRTPFRPFPLLHSVSTISRRFGALPGCPLDAAGTGSEAGFVNSYLAFRDCTVGEAARFARRFSFALRGFGWGGVAVSSSH